MPEGQGGDVRRRLSRWKRFLLGQKYRFDMGHQFLAIVNFALLLIAASDKLRYYTSIPRTWLLLVVMMPLGFFGVWLFGCFLDEVVKYQQAYALESVKRDPFWEQNQAFCRKVEAELELIRGQLEARGTQAPPPAGA
jgi:hypothetical protein